MAYINPSVMPEIRSYLNSAPVDVYSIARGLGVAVFNSELPQNISGMLIRNDKFEIPQGIHPSVSGWSIIVNSLESRKRQRFTIAHELGHFVMHRNLPQLKDGVIEDTTFYRSDLSGGAEIEANRFAADILMPINQVMASYRMNPDIKALAERFDVSEAAMRVRLEFSQKHAA